MKRKHAVLFLLPFVLGLMGFSFQPHNQQRNTAATHDLHSPGYVVGNMATLTPVVNMQVGDMAYVLSPSQYLYWDGVSWKAFSWPSPTSTVTITPTPAVTPTKTPDANTKYGLGAGTSITTGNDNDLFGEGAGRGITEGNYNSIFGHNNGYSFGLSSWNAVFGQGALSSGGVFGDPVSHNCVVGIDSALGMVKGDYNTVLGCEGNTALIQTGSIVLGHGAGNFNKGDYKLSIGLSNFIGSPEGNHDLIEGDMMSRNVTVYGNLVVCNVSPTPTCVEYPAP